MTRSACERRFVRGPKGVWSANFFPLRGVLVKELYLGCLLGYNDLLIEGLCEIEERMY